MGGAMLEQFETQNLKALWQRQLLALALVEPMAANYQLFVEVSGQGDAKLFTNILDLVWQQLTGQGPKIDWTKQREKLELIIPDDVQFEGFGVRPARDACVALGELLTFLDERDDNALSAIWRTYLAGIEDYLEFTGEQVTDHPLYHYAGDYSESMIELIGRSGSQQQVLKAVKTCVSEWEFSNIGLQRQD
jgi:uncharacterized protein YjaG (DUF416 family)